MPRNRRIVVPGVPMHVVQRGNYRQDIFEDEGNRLRFIALARERLQVVPLKVHGWCLMTNHVHLLVVPENEDDPARFFRSVLGEYATYFNFLRGRRGHLFQARYFSCPIEDDDHALQVLRYIERNPVRAGLADRAEDYPYSSAAAHVRGTADPLLAGGWPLREVLVEWPQLLRDEEESLALELIRQATFRGAKLRLPPPHGEAQSQRLPKSPTPARLPR